MTLIHYSNTNIHNHSILEILQSPLFILYHDGQPFNENHLRPCPMLENPEILRRLVKESGAYQTNAESPENVDELCDKTVNYAEDWGKVADKLWRIRKI